MTLQLGVPLEMEEPIWIQRISKKNIKLVTEKENFLNKRKAISTIKDLKTKR